MPNQITNVFVSYSHADASLVAPVVKLLRANKSLVFQDIDSIQPGKKWRNEIAEGLAESDLVVVFWCDHASRSDDVCKEWKAAVEQEKDVLPLLLDATPLPPELGDFQWIDFRATVGANHASIVSPPSDAKRTEPPPLRERAKPGRWLTFGNLAAVAAGVVAGIWLLTLKSPPPSPLPPVQVPTPAPSPPMESFPPSGSQGGGSGLLWLVLILAVIFWLWRRRSKRKRPVEITPIRFPDINKIARDIEEEILRRMSSKHDVGA